MRVFHLGQTKPACQMAFPTKLWYPLLLLLKAKVFTESFFSNMPSKVHLTKMFMVPLLQAGFMALLMSWRRYSDKYRYTFSAKLKQYIQSLLITLWKISLYIFDSYSKGKAHIKKARRENFPSPSTNKGHQRYNGWKSHISRPLPFPRGVLKSQLFYIV